MIFANALRSILRQDPDVIMIGEIRDRDTAEIAILAAQTGHLVLSTLHTNNAPATVTRLLNMGIPPYLVVSSIIGIIAQRLCPLICNKCKESYIPSDQWISRLKMNYKNLPIKFYRGKGCNLCENMGYFGRTCISEVMEFNRKGEPVDDGTLVSFRADAGGLSPASAGTLNGVASSILT